MSSDLERARTARDEAEKRVLRAAIYWRHRNARGADLSDAVDALVKLAAEQALKYPEGLR